MTTSDGPEHPAGRPPRREPRETAHPHDMSEAEKRMAEWEARHDVAARGHRGTPGVVQHYFAHERLTHSETRAAPDRHVLPEQHVLPEEHAERSARAERIERPRGWLRRIFRR